MSRKPETSRVPVAAAALLGILVLLFVPIAAAGTGPSVQVIASGLDNPRGLAFGSGRTVRYTSRRQAVVTPDALKKIALRGRSGRLAPGRPEL